MPEQTQKAMQTATGQTLGIGVGNACAYFFIAYLSWKYKFEFEDPVVAVAMGGTLFGVIVLQFGRIVRAIGFFT